MALVQYSETVALPTAQTATYYLWRVGYKHVPFIRQNATVTTYQYRESSSKFVRHFGTYNRPITATLFHSECSSLVGLPSSPTGELGSYRDFVTNKALARFSDKWKGDTAQWAATLAEGQEALNLIAHRLGTIYQSFRALKRGNIREFAKILGVKAKRKHRRRPRWEIQRRASSLWLEYWFGWSPMIGEVYTSLSVLEADFPYERYRASAKVNVERSTASGSLTGNHLHQSASYILRCSVGATIKVTNPNLLLLNRMGLVNPASVAWEIIPFSFMADYVYNVSQVLNAFTEYVGVSIENPWRIYTAKTEDGWYSYRSGTSFWIEHQNGRCFAFHRQAGLPQVTLASKHIKGLSKTRAATMASLVVALFAPK